MNPIGRISQAHTPRRLAWRRTHAVYGASTSVYQSTRNTAQAQNLNRTIHCVTFANSSEIDLQAGGAESHTIWRNTHDLLVANTAAKSFFLRGTRDARRVGRRTLGALGRLLRIVLAVTPLRAHVLAR